MSCGVGVVGIRAWLICCHTCTLLHPHRISPVGLQRCTTRSDEFVLLIRCFIWVCEPLLINNCTLVTYVECDCK